jgi:cell division protein FtsZ
LINLDFADVRSIMSEGGAALMAVGHGTSENRAVDAAHEAISSQLLDVTIDGARGILFNVTGGPDLSLFEVNEAAEIIRQTAHPEVNIIFGAVIDENLGDEVRITVVATGFDATSAPPSMRRRPHAIARVSTQERQAAPQPVQQQPQQKPPSRSQIEMQVPQLVGNDELDIPPFLRRR